MARKYVDYYLNTVTPVFDVRVFLYLKTEYEWSTAVKFTIFERQFSSFLATPKIAYYCLV